MLITKKRNGDLFNINGTHHKVSFIDGSWYLGSVKLSALFTKIDSHAVHAKIKKANQSYVVLAIDFDGAIT